MPSDRPPHPLLAGDVVGGREHDGLAQLVQLLARQRVDDGQPLDRVAEHLDAQHRLVVGRVHLDGVAPDPELAPPERQVVPVVLQVDQAAQDRALVVVDPGVELQQLAPVLGRVAHAVDAGDRGDDDRVPPREEGGGGRVAQPVDLVVDRRVLLDVGVARGHVRLGLVVVVVADEVLHPVLREELLHLLGELGGEALVGGDDERRLLDGLDRPGDRGALARARDAEQGLEAVPPLDAFGERGDGRRLVAGGLERGLHEELGHGLHVTVPPNLDERMFAAAEGSGDGAPRTSPGRATGRRRSAGPRPAPSCGTPPRPGRGRSSPRRTGRGRAAPAGRGR